MSEDKFEQLMSSKEFDIEHALGMHALSYYSIPAEGIYEEGLEERLGPGVKDCHIYLIGELPKLDLKGARQIGRTLLVDFEVLGETRSISQPLPDGLDLTWDDDLWYLADGTDNRYGPSEGALVAAFIEQYGPLPFKVVYVGQAYGKDGTRHALTRLRKHETLQKISLSGVPEGYRLHLLLLDITLTSRLYTMINPLAENNSDGEIRIANGLDKLFDTSEHERITLYEASLITYFQPDYNKEFKNSFPSTNLKVLEDCYEKDFNSLIAELNFDDLPFELCSDVVEQSLYHTVHIELHEDAKRKVFFGLEP